MTRPFITTMKVKALCETVAFIQLELLRFLVDPRYQVDKAQTTTLSVVYVH